MSGALQGIRVVELGRYIAAPYAGKLLADFGADVIKVEDTSRGDPMRVWQDGNRPYSPQFAAYNRNKRGIALDLKRQEGREAFLQLASGAEVVLENFRPSVLDRLGIGWDVLSAADPSLVYCSITGFGSRGPYVDRPAYDTIISAMSGMYGMLIDPQAPRPVGPAFSDLLSGQSAALGILAALHTRERSGNGQRLEVSMLGAVLNFLTEAATNYLDTGEVTERDTRQRRAQAYGLVAADGLPFVVHMSVPDKFWIATTDAMGVAHLRNSTRFATRQDRYDHYEDLETELQAAAGTRPRSEWMKILTDAGVPHAPVNSIGDVFADPQVQEMNMVEEVSLPGDDQPIRMAGQGMSLSATPISPERPAAPSYGEHTDEVLGELGLDDEVVRSWRDQGVIR